MLDIGMGFHLVTHSCGSGEVHGQPSGDETEIAISDGTNAVTESQIRQGHQHGTVRSARRIGMALFDPDAESRRHVSPRDPHRTDNGEKRAGIERFESIRHVLFF